ncbi:MAG TPA: acetolactate synthase large subunit, partial [Burkholderiaceae bacterium]|nr:acetolactate synthase large subunit [Burkholderiaceae bacterium]
VLNEGQSFAWRIAQATEASLMADYVNARVSRGRGRLQLERVPYNIDLAIEALAGFEEVVLVGARVPVGFFAYPGKPSVLTPPKAQVHVLSRPDQDPVAALRALAEQLRAPQVAPPDPGPRPELSTGAPTPEKLARTVAALLPENAIVSDESVSYGRGFYRYTHAAAPHEWLHLAGGAIGDGIPIAAGAAIGAGRGCRVLNLQADGSAMYSLQALWTQARERLPVTTVILSNRKYGILIGEYKAVGASPGPNAMRILDLADPHLDWVHLARGMGVEAARATTMEECARLMAASFSGNDPFLIELLI